MKHFVGILVLVAFVLMLEQSPCCDAAIPEAVTRSRPCIACFAYWSKEHCESRGMDHYPGSCYECSACIPRNTVKS